MPTAFATRLATLAEAEYNTYRGLHETTTKMSNRIRTYWTDLGWAFPGVSTAWSAVFVSFLVKSAGAVAGEFDFSARHAKFVHTAIANANAGTGVFRAFSPSAYAPKIGDIIQNNRGNTFDFAYATNHDSYPSHSAIVVEEGVDGSGRYVRTVGGNEGDTVGDRVVRLTNAGLMKAPSAAPDYYISVIQTLK
jgi:Uncharacterized protein conserved in bacteria